MRSLCIIVPKNEVNTVRKKLKELCLLRNELKMHRERELFFIPVLEDPKLGFELGEREFEKMERRAKSYRELIEVPPSLTPYLPTSFDVVGSIAILKLHEPIIPYRVEIGSALLKCHKNIRTVVLDRGVGGERRLRDIEVIAGLRTTETVHKEHGLSFLLDISKVYFSPRLGTERWRVAEKVQRDEIVLDMFAGVGSFSILIAKYKEPKKIYAIDVNPDAIMYLKRNIQRNKVERVIPILGDAKEKVKNLEEKCDRIIMNLPFSSHEFFNSALSVLSDEGTIHYYDIIERTEIGKRLKELRLKAERCGRGLVLARLEEVKTYSPTMAYHSIDFQLPVK